MRTRALGQEVCRGKHSFQRLPAISKSHDSITTIEPKTHHTNDRHPAKTEALVRQELLLELQRRRQIAVLESPICNKVKQQTQTNQNQGIDNGRKHTLRYYFSETPRGSESTF